MKLDISEIPIKHTLFSWVSGLLEGNEITKLIISPQQAKEVFSNITGKTFKSYMGVPIEVIKKTDSKDTEIRIKNRINQALSKGLRGASLVIPITSTSRFVMERVDIVEAIYEKGRKEGI